MSTKFLLAGTLPTASGADLTAGIVTNGVRNFYAVNRFAASGSAAFLTENLPTSASITTTATTLTITGNATITTAGFYTIINRTVYMNASTARFIAGGGSVNGVHINLVNCEVQIDEAEGSGFSLEFVLGFNTSAGDAATRARSVAIATGQANCSSMNFYGCNILLTGAPATASNAIYFQWGDMIACTVITSARSTLLNNWSSSNGGRMSYTDFKTNQLASQAAQNPYGAFALFEGNELYNSALTVGNTGVALPILATGPNFTFPTQATYYFLNANDSVGTLAATNVVLQVVNGPSVGTTQTTIFGAGFTGAGLVGWGGGNAAWQRGQHGVVQYRAIGYTFQDPSGALIRNVRIRVANNQIVVPGAASYSARIPNTAPTGVTTINDMLTNTSGVLQSEKYSLDSGTSFTAGFFNYGTGQTSATVGTTSMFANTNGLTLTNQVAPILLTRVTSSSTAFVSTYTTTIAGRSFTNEVAISVSDNSSTYTQRTFYGDFGGLTTVAQNASVKAASIAAMNASATGNIDSRFLAIFVSAGTPDENDLFDAVRYEWFNFTTNATVNQPVGAAMNFGAQNLIINSAATGGTIGTKGYNFDTASQTWTFRAPTIFTNQNNAVNQGIVTTGTVDLISQAGSGAVNVAPITANTIDIGTPGNPATFTITPTPLIAAGTGTLTLSGLGALQMGGSVTTGNITTTTNAATNAANIAALLQSALPAGSTVTSQAGGGGTQATITITLIGSSGGTSVGTITFTPTNTGGGFAPTYTVPVNFRDALTVLQGLSTPAGWTKGTVSGSAGFNSTCSVTYTRVATGPVFTGTVAGGNVTVSGTGSNFFTANASTASNAFTASGVNGQQNYLLNFSVTATDTAVTPVPVLTSTIAGLITSAPATNIVASTASTEGTTLYQSLTANTYIGLPTSGAFLGAGGSFNGGMFTLQAEGSVSTTGGTSTAHQTFAIANNAYTVTFNDTNLGNSITVDTGTSDTYQMYLYNCELVSNLIISRTGTGTVNVLIAGLTTNGFTVTYGTGVNAVVQQTISLLGTASALTSDIKVARMWIDGVERTSAPLFTYTRDGTNNIVATVVGGIPATATNFYVVFFIDGFNPVGSGSQPIGVNLALSGSTIIPANLDFTTTLSAVDNDVISRASVTYTPTVVSPYAPPIVSVNIPNNAFLTPGNSNLYSTASIGIAKLVVRRVLELAANTTYHQAIASNAIASIHIEWTSVGYQVNNGTQGGTETFRFILAKDIANVNSLIIMDLFITSSGFLQFPNQDNYLYSTITSNIAQAIVVLVKSPGAVLQLSSADQQALAGYAVTGITTNPIGLPKTNQGISDASKLIPWNP